jgi:hypothetical protein
MALRYLRETFGYLPGLLRQDPEHEKGVLRS